MGKNKKKNKKNDVEMIDSDVEMFADMRMKVLFLILKSLIIKF